MSFTEFFGVVKDIALTGTGITGAIVAVQGLSTWRRQLHGQADYNLAKDILINLFKYRDTLNRVRNPAIFSYEMPLPPEDKRADMSAPQIRYYGLVEAYNSRYDKVTIERANLYTTVIESQALWGDELKGLLSTLFNYERLLFLNIKYHLVLSDPNIEDGNKNFERANFKSEILYDNLSEDDDKFRNDFSSSLEPIEIYLKTKLAKEPPENEHINKVVSYFKTLKMKLCSSRSS